MTLDESEFSDIDDPALVDNLLDVIYKGTDNRPAWIGAHRPRTTLDALRVHADWAFTHYEFYLAFVREFMERKGAVLDIGCGAGQNTAMLSRYSRTAIGIDSDPKAAAFARKHNTVTGASFIAGEFPAPTGPDGWYDYVFAVETLEHVPYEAQERFIKSALALLTTDGLMFITTPREDTPAAPHIGVWSREWSKKMLDEFKENVVRCGHFDNTRPSAGFVDNESTHRALVLRP
jgi:2-polyprenyl-3-methyl-5-hydroxy-6-metoxy-1,4-benzoquinol methylase